MLWRGRRGKWKSLVFSPRHLARFIDQFICILPFVIIGADKNAPSWLVRPEDGIILPNVYAFLILAFTYEVVSNWKLRATPGKLIMRIGVVRDKYSAVGGILDRISRQGTITEAIPALARAGNVIRGLIWPGALDIAVSRSAALNFIAVMFLVANEITMVRSTKGRSIHDMLAGTIVVNGYLLPGPRKATMLLPGQPRRRSYPRILRPAVSSASHRHDVAPRDRGR